MQGRAAVSVPPCPEPRGPADAGRWGASMPEDWSKELARLRGWFAEVSQEEGQVEIFVAEWVIPLPNKRTQERYEWPSISAKRFVATEWISPEQIIEASRAVVRERAFRVHSEAWRKLRPVAAAAGHVLPRLIGVTKFVQPKTLAIPDEGKRWIFALADMSSPEVPDCPFPILRRHWRNGPGREFHTKPTNDPFVQLANMGIGSHGYDLTRWFVPLDDAGSLSARACAFLLDRCASVRRANDPPLAPPEPMGAPSEGIHAERAPSAAESQTGKHPSKRIEPLTLKQVAEVITCEAREDAVRPLLQTLGGALEKLSPKRWRVIDNGLAAKTRDDLAAKVGDRSKPKSNKH